MLTPSATSQSRITPSERVIVGNVRVSLRRRPARLLGVRTHTVTAALPTSSPATRSNMTSIPTNSHPDDTGRSGRAASPGRSSARTQTHALTGSNQAAPEDPAPYTSSGSPTRTSVFRRRRTTPRFSSASATTVQAVANDYTSCITGWVYSLLRIPYRGGEATVTDRKAGASHDSPAGSSGADVRERRQRPDTI